MTVRSSQGLEVSEGPPYGTRSSEDGEHRTASSAGSMQPPGLPLRLDGLMEHRPEGWHYDRGDPMWQDYLWTAMLDPVELTYGVDITCIVATTVRGRPAWAATCRPHPRSNPPSFMG